MRNLWQRIQEHMADLSTVLQENLTGVRVVRAFGAERHEEAKFDLVNQKVARDNVRATALRTRSTSLTVFGFMMTMVAIIGFGGYLVVRGDMSPGELAQFIFFMQTMMMPVRMVGWIINPIARGIAAGQRMFEILDTRTETADRPGAVVLPPFSSEIEFRDVTFRYPDDEGAVLRGVSFAVRAGEVMAVVGLSGAGKSTLVNLVPRFHDVTGGAILIDGVDVRDVTLPSLRRAIGIVTQETFLFDASVADNIAYAAPGTPRESIVAVARAAHAHEFIVDLPQGYDTVIGERGQRLSGGQRQRLTIARALLKNPPILVLDEATSALDAESELLVQDALARLLLNRTAFVIAHRLSTIRRADAIIVLEGGRVVESGRHEELLARPGSSYAKLYATQVFGQEGEERAMATASPAGPARPAAGATR